MSCVQCYECTVRCLVLSSSEPVAVYDEPNSSAKCSLAAFKLQSSSSC
jgi:hypothetical protein